MSKTTIKLKLTDLEIKLLIGALTDSLDVANSHDFTNDAAGFQRMLERVRKQMDEQATG